MSLTRGRPDRPQEPLSVPLAVEKGRGDVGFPTAVSLGLAIWMAWTAATYLMEGRILTLERPAAVGVRLRYTLIANLGIGIVCAAFLLRRMVGRDLVAPQRLGFSPPGRSLVAALIGALLGFVTYIVQGPPTLQPVVLLNGYAQVLVVSIAEVIVCWAVIGGTLEAALTRRIGRAGTLVAALAAAVLFGLYHYAHSPPFNTHTMVAVLTGVGLVTGAFFFVSRDVYSTVAFHNFLGVFGVIRALDGAGRLHSYASLQVPLLASAALGIAALVAVHRAWLRPTESRQPSS